MKKLVLESTSPFQGLPELVAYDEGLFEKEGLLIEWAERDEAGIKQAEALVDSPKGVDPFGHGKLLEAGKADMYNACEWATLPRGSYRRRQPPGRAPRDRGLCGHRGAAGLARLHRPAARRPHRRRPVLCRHALSRAASLGGFLPRDQIKVVRAPTARATAST
jgi:hypothetical protein